MKITKIEKKPYRDWFNYYICSDDKELRILFSGNGDLYFCLHNYDKKFDTCIYFSSYDSKY